MTIPEIIGYLMLAVLPAWVFIAIYKSDGFAMVVFVMGGVSAVMLWLYGATYLIFEY